MRKLAFGILVLLAAGGGRPVAPAPAGGKAGAGEAAVTGRRRDAALARAYRYLDERLWKLPAAGSPRRQFSFAAAGLGYLLGADGKGGKRLPSRVKALARIHGELARYAERVADLYRREAKRAARRPPRGSRAGPDGVMPGMGLRTAQYVWPLGAAALFFAESSKRGFARGESRKALRAIVLALEACQQENGGWGHDDASRPGMGLPPIRIPKPWGGTTVYPGTLIAASNCALSGLGLAHAVLRTKRAPALVRGRTYYRNSQNADGTFPYDPSQKLDGKLPGWKGPGPKRRPGGRGVPGGSFHALFVARTAGAAFALFCAGAKDRDPVALAALKAVDAAPGEVSEGHGSATLALMFGALLARARGDRAWSTFRRLFFARILDHQEPSGAFTCICRNGPGVTCDTRPLPGVAGAMMGDYVEQQKVYVTALHVLILALDRVPPRAVPAMPGPAGAITPTGK